MNWIDDRLHEERELAARKGISVEVLRSMTYEDICAMPDAIAPVSPFLKSCGIATKP